MLAQWFKQDIDAILNEHNRVVVTDKDGKGSYLMDTLHDYTVLKADDELSELKARYEAEKYHASEPVVFYVTQLSQLRYLMEYAVTGGQVSVDNLEQYIREKVWQHLKENPKVDGKTLLTAAKLSHGQNEKWWKKIIEGLEEPFNVADNVLLFLSNPTAYSQRDQDIRQLLVEKICEMTGLTHSGQTFETLAKEVWKAIFDRLLNNSLQGELLDIYRKMTNLVDMKPSLEAAIREYVIPKDADFRMASPDHCFTELDRRMERELSKSISDHQPLDAFKKYINDRLSSKTARDYKPYWLSDVNVLLNFTTKGLSDANSLEEVARFYQEHFTTLDAAMRHLYVEWLNEEKVLRPLQYLYEQFERELLGRWYMYTADYKPNQHGFIAEKLNEPGRIAVIAGDGLRLSIAETVRRNFPDKGVKVETNTLYAALPSVTENGMSELYGIEPKTTDAQKRIHYLQGTVPSVVVVSLDQLNDSITAEKLVLRFGDIDEVGEKKQLAGLKDINSYEALLTEKIQQLLQMGYRHVWVTTDHGFVLTGILDDADKQPLPNQPVNKVDERFLLSDSPISDDKLIERSDDFFGSSFQYYAHTDKPFVTTGSYGYSHGGFTPQECVIPAYDFQPSGSDNLVSVHILNKKDLMDVAGTSFIVKLKAEGNAGNLFGNERKIKVIVYENGKPVQTSQTINARPSQDMNELEFEMVDMGKVVIVDATTKEQLDSATLQKSDARDLGGLL